MPHVVLYEPEIPPNTGNIIRLCANTGFELHLVKPLGFSLDDRRLRRAGLDYAEWARVRTWETLEDCRQELGGRVLGITTRGRRRHDEVDYAENDLLLFGPETRGLPAAVLDGLEESSRVRIPMRPQSRSMNLSNAVAVVIYEAWRQLGFDGAG